MTESTRALGARGEDAVARWYRGAGYQVLDRNWRCREGELDLIVARPGELVFCEVKTRRGTAFGAPFEAVTNAKQRRIRTLALRWLVNFSRARRENSMAERLVAEIMDASNGQGASVKRREDMHKMAEANRAFAHYRW